MSAGGRQVPDDMGLGRSLCVMLSVPRVCCRMARFPLCSKMSTELGFGGDGVRVLST